MKTRTLPNPQLAAMERELISIDGVIRRCEDERSAMVADHKSVPEIETACAFLGTLRRRREIILHELKKAGGSEAGAYHRKEEIERELACAVAQGPL